MMMGKLVFTPLGHIPPIFGRPVSQASPPDLAPPAPCIATGEPLPPPQLPVQPVSRFAHAGLEDDLLPVQAPRHHRHRH